jgi:hypothetical protein
MCRKKSSVVKNKNAMLKLFMLSGEFEQRYGGLKRRRIDDDCNVKRRVGGPVK